MKVCMISSSFLPIIGGLQFQVKWLAEELAKQGVEIYLLSYLDGERFVNIQENGFPRFININDKNNIYRFIKLYKTIRNLSPDILHVHMPGLIAFRISVLKGLGFMKTPFIVTSHGMDIMICKDINYGLRLRLTNALAIKYILHESSRHVIVGKSMKRFALSAGSKRNKITEINNGIPTKENVSDDVLNEVRYKYQICPDENILLSLSGLRPLKGLEYLIRAMPMILEKFPHTRLLLACKGREYEKYLKDLVKGLKIEQNVNFIGFVEGEEKFALIELCDVFCKPSLLEACSVAILEAMQREKLVVASIPGGIDIITDNRNGLLTKTKDPKDIAKKVIRVLTDRKLKSKIEKQAGEDVKKFTIEKTAQKYASLYYEIYRKYRAVKHNIFLNSAE